MLFFPKPCWARHQQSGILQFEGRLIECWGVIPQWGAQIWVAFLIFLSPLWRPVTCDCIRFNQWYPPQLLLLPSLPPCCHTWPQAPSPDSSFPLRSLLPLLPCSIAAPSVSSLGCSHLVSPTTLPASRSPIYVMCLQYCSWLCRPLSVLLLSSVMRCRILSVKDATRK